MGKRKPRHKTRRTRPVKGLPTANGASRHPRQITRVLSARIQEHLHSVVLANQHEVRGVNTHYEKGSPEFELVMRSLRRR